jgi:hypothetical protein
VVPAEIKKKKDRKKVIVRTTHSINERIFFGAHCTSMSTISENLPELLVHALEGRWQLFAIFYM